MSYRPKNPNELRSEGHTSAKSAATHLRGGESRKVCSYVETNPHLDTLALSPRGSDNHRSASDLTLT